MNRARRLAPYAVLLLVAMAGCLSPGANPATGPDDSPQGTVRQTLSTDTSLPPPEAGFGHVDGTVLNENGAPLEGARVSLFGTSFDAVTDVGGKFRFVNVEAGRYTIRADLDPYSSLESPVDVVAGRTVQVDVVLLSPEQNVGFRDHVHDFWGDEAELELHNRAHPFPSSKVAGMVDVPSCAAAFVTDALSKAAGCWSIPFTFVDGRIVPPGTKELQVTITWPKQDALSAVDFRWTDSNGTQGEFKGVPSGDVRVIPLEPVMTDHGHAVFTLWDFEIVAKPKLAGQLSMQFQQFNEEFIGPLQVRITALKGVVPAEAPHARFWAGGDRISLLDQSHKIMGPTPPKRDPTATYCASVSVCFNATQGLIVPPGTTRLEIAMTWTWGQAILAPAFHEKRLAVRPGGTNPALATLGGLLVPATDASASTSAHWVVDVDPEWTDAFYQKRSTWLFLVAHMGAERAEDYAPDCPSSCGGDLVTLRVEAVNGDWTPDLYANV